MAWSNLTADPADGHASYSRATAVEPRRFTVGLGTFVREDTAVRSEEADDDELALRLAQLEHRLAEFSPELPAQIEELQRSVGLLQAQMVELRDRAGLEPKVSFSPAARDRK